MAVKIRLARHGAKKRPYYRIIVADSRKPRDGKFIEEVGRYNPCVSPSFVTFDIDRVQYWLGVGAQPTDTVARLWESYDGPSAVTGVTPAPAKKAAPAPAPAAAAVEEPAAEEVAEEVEATEQDA